MIEVLGWLSTVLVLAGYILNAKGLDKSAMVLWIVGDVGWPYGSKFSYNNYQSLWHLQ